MADNTISFDTWEGGEFGDLGAAGAQRGMFSGQNLMRYQDGTVGPRPGVRELEPTGAAAGAVWAFRGLGAEATNGQVYGQGSNLYGFTLAPLGAVVAIGTVSTTATVASQLIQYGPAKGELARYADKIYEVDTDLPRVTPLASSPGATVLASYGIRLMAANASNTATATAIISKRVYYSAAADTSSWPALNYFDVGNIDWPVTHIDEIRQRLVIGNEGGEWWALSGTPGVNDSLRRQPRGDLSPERWYHAVRSGESIWFFPQGEDFPVQFTGIVVDKLRFRHLRFTAGSGNDFAVTAAPVGEVVLAVEDGGSNRGLLFANDTWTYHTFGVTTSRFLSPASVGGAGADLDMPILLCDGGGASSPKFYAFVPMLDRPAKTNDTYAQPGDDSDTPLSVTLNTPAIQAKEGSECWARKITVTGFAWDTGASSSNHFDLVCRSWFRRDKNDVRDSAIISKDIPDPSADKTPFQRSFSVGDQQPGEAFQIRLSNIRGIAIKSIEVDVEERARAG